MVDVLTLKQRSYNMKMIRSKDTTPELIMRTTLCRLGYRWYRLHTDLPGHPDIVFAGKNIAVFIDGCFWHHCPICFVRPATRRRFWDKKISQNIQRDRFISSHLKKDGWTVLRFWEHQVRKEPEKCCRIVIRYLKR
ncbi:very short patch repair endonuclease [Candidatus Micrarchaeota archaeon CG08_land_8_20_14_0_20_49_17]|nr:MAG: very short patch repair endonuclease [Candidatus Micrarchaeota archaeon CG08_land_8_20_14_0_20_49_17]